MMKRRSTVFFGLIVLAVLALVAFVLFKNYTQTLVNQAPAPGFVQGTAVLKSPSSSYVISSSYPQDNIRIELSVNYKEAGMILDTVGVGKPQTGSFRLSVAPTGALVFAIYDPGKSSPFLEQNGWHVLTSTTRLTPNYNHLVAVEVYKGTINIWIGNDLEQKVALATTLSGGPVYIGDYPYDWWHVLDQVNTGMVGNVYVTYFGPLDTNLYGQKKVLGN